MSSAPTDIERLGRLPDSLWQQLRERPERAPELIALAASERFAGPAERWVQVAGPGHTPESLAKEAYKKHVRLARVEGLALGLGGITTAALNLGGLAWIQARMVFYIAAAHGYDPRHPMRPAELLALWEVYETPAGVADHWKQTASWDEFAAIGAWMSKVKVTTVHGAPVVHSLW